MPTHDHGQLIHSAIRCVLAQSYTDFELLIVGDGVVDETREIVDDYQRVDPRVTFFDLPKGPRNGELHRHQVLTTRARGSLVAYAADDDIWLSCHLADMSELLQSADFVQALRIIWPDRKSAYVQTGDVSVPPHRKALIEGTNIVGLSNAAHTMELYRRLPHGWRTTPPDRPTDWYMWQQILSLEDCRALSGSRPTVINLQQAHRNGWSFEERQAELLHWEEFSRRPDAAMKAAEQMIAVQRRRNAELEDGYRELAGGNARLTEERAASQRQTEAQATEIARLREAYAEARKGAEWLERERQAWQQQAGAYSAEIARLNLAYADANKGTEWLERERQAWQQKAEAAMTECTRLADSS
jgi:glycosyltransferase involved in cell wall biosynthesis